MHKFVELPKLCGRAVHPVLHGCLAAVRLLRERKHSLTGTLSTGSHAL